MVTATPVFAQSSVTKAVVCTAAVASFNTDAPTGTVKLLTAGANGGKLTRLWAIPRATVTATRLDAYSSLDAGTTKRLFDSELMAAYTLAATTAVPEIPFSNYSEASPKYLAPGEEVYVSIAVALADGIVFYAEYQEF